MELSTHNSWSYAGVYSWYMKPLNKFSQCQDWTIKKQLDEGIRCFDLRVRFDEDGNPYPCHGLVRYKSKIIEGLENINTYAMMNDKAPYYVRVMLENNFINDKEFNEFQVELYRLFCEKIEKMFPKIIFWGGWDRKNWGVKIHDFQTRIPYIYELYSSVDKDKSRTAYKLLPRTYAKKFNKTNIKNAPIGYEFMMIDFINIQ